MLIIRLYYSISTDRICFSNLEKNIDIKKN